MLKQPITITITVKESQLNYNHSYIKLNATKLCTDRQDFYIHFFQNKMTNDYLTIKVAKMPLQNR